MWDPTSCGPRLAVDPAHVGVGTISVSISGVSRPDWGPRVPGAGDADYHLLFRSRASFSFTCPPLEQSLLNIPDGTLGGHLGVHQMSQVLREGWMKDHILVVKVENFLLHHFLDKSIMDNNLLKIYTFKSNKYPVAAQKQFLTLRKIKVKTYKLNLSSTLNPRVDWIHYVHIFTSIPLIMQDFDNWNAFFMKVGYFYIQKGIRSYSTCSSKVSTGYSERRVVIEEKYKVLDLLFI